MKEWERNDRKEKERENGWERNESMGRNERREWNGKGWERIRMIEWEGMGRKGE